MSGGSSAWQAGEGTEAGRAGGQEGSSLAGRFLRRLRPWLGDSRVPGFAALAAVVLAMPSLWNGLDLDDWIHRVILTRAPGLAWMVPSPANPFTFFNGDRERTRALVDIGIAPWWTNFDLRIQFWRPLATLSHRLDYVLWPTHPGVMHAQSLVWMGLLVVAVGALYRRIGAIDREPAQGAWVAGLATVMFAIDDAHGFPVGWIANRNALMATLFGVLALWAYDRWRRDGWGRGAVLAPAAFGLSMLSAELGVATSAYLLAYALFLDRGRWLERLARLLPCVAVGACWSWSYRALGFGAWGSGYYLDPVREPVRFGRAVLERGPILWQGLLGMPPADVYLLLPKGVAKAQYVGSLAFLAVTVAVFAPMLRRSATSRFWALGAGLSLLPVCATFPMDRLLLFVGLGGIALVARFLGEMAGEGVENAVLSGARGGPGEGLEPGAGEGAGWDVGTGARTGAGKGRGEGAGEGAGWDVKTGAGKGRWRALREGVGEGAGTAGGPSGSRRVPWGRPARALALFWVSIHLVLAPLLLPLRAANPGRWEYAVEHLSASIPDTDPAGVGLAGQDLVVVNGPDGTFPGFVKLIRTLEGRPAPVHIWTLGVGTQALEVSRPDVHTLVVRPEGGFLADRGAPLVRDGRDGMHLGERVALSGMTAEVTALTGDGRPAEATFRFARALEDPTLRWVRWQGKELAPFVPPAVGQTVTVPAVELGLGR